MNKLKEALNKLNKNYGTNTISPIKEMEKVEVQRIKSQSVGLDRAMSGGYPKGRIIEIYGPESSGKTTLCLHAIAEVQKQGGVAAFIDAEHALDTGYAADLGVDVDNLLLSQPDYGEQALDIVDKLSATGEVSLIIVDSVAALVPKSELEGEIGDSKIGLHAKLMSQTLRKVKGVVSQTNTTVIFINQLREKIGVMFGSPEVTTGGNALKFYASVRLDIRRSTQIKDGDEVIGNRTKVKVVKSKVGPPFRKAEFDIMYGQGISKVGEIIDFGVEFEIIQRSGSWYSYENNKVGQGRDAVKQLLIDNPELCEEIEEKLVKKMNQVIEDVVIVEESSDFFEEAATLFIIQKNGAYYSYADQRLGKGKAASKQYLEENADLRDEIIAKIKASDD